MIQHAEYTAQRKWKVSQVRDLCKHLTDEGAFELLIEWHGFPPEEATWEPLGFMVADIPDLVRAFLQNGVPASAKKLLPEVRRLEFIKTLLRSKRGGSVTT